MNSLNFNVDFLSTFSLKVLSKDAVVDYVKFYNAPVMAILVISNSSDSSKDSVGTPAGRSDPSEDPSSDHIPPLPAISPFLSSDDDTTDSDTPDTPPSPTHGTPFTEITASTQRSPIIPRRRVMILSPGQPIPHGRPYRYHLNGPVHMMTARKRVGPLPTHRLAVRHSADHSSSDSSSEASSDFHSDASSDSSSRHSLSDHSSPDLPSTSAGPSRKRRRSPMASVPALPLVSGALSPVHADLIPSPKRIRDSGYLADVEVDPSEVRLGIDVEDESFEQSRSRGTDLEVDDDVERSEEPHSEPEIDPVEAVIEACFDFADIIRASGVDVRVEAVTVARDDVETSARDPIVVSDDGDTPPVVPEVIPEPAQEERVVEGTYETLGDLGVQREQGHRNVGVESAVIALTERIAELERDNKRLRGTASVEIEVAIIELEVSEEEFIEINETIYLNEGSKAFLEQFKPVIDRLKHQGYIREEPLKHWKKNGELCKLDIINPDITIEDRPLKYVTPAMEDSFKKHVDRTTIDLATGREIKGKEMMVFNYKSLNDNTYKDQYSLPGINMIIKRVGGAKIFSKFDIKSGFHQVAMDEESIPWTAFLVPGGLYEWLLVRKIKERVQNLLDLEIPPENVYIILETDGCMEGWGGIGQIEKARMHRRNEAISSSGLYSVEEVLQSPNAFQKNMKIICEEIMKISNHF
ncbi:hypothetical protein Tco_0994547 [Tanacetum coccineum]